MKTMILAAAAVLAIGAGSAFAEGEGGATAEALQWQAENGNPRVPATEYFAQHRNQVRQQQGYAAVPHTVRQSNG